MYVALILSASIAAANQTPSIKSTPVQKGETFSGWDKLAVLPQRPFMMYVSAGRPALVLKCEGISMQAQVRGFVAPQAWPQPAMAVTFGSAEITDRPDLSLIGRQTAFTIHSDIRDSILNPIRRGLPIRAIFNGKTLSFPPPPEALREEFSAKCAALVHPGMRAF